LERGINDSIIEKYILENLSLPLSFDKLRAVSLVGLFSKEG
jgi:hypothetical protein